jgi:hypothetical protein
MEVLIPLLVLCLVVFLAFWIIDMLPFPHPVGLIAKVIIAILVLVKLLALLGINVGHFSLT